MMCRLMNYAREDTKVSRPMHITVRIIIFEEGIQEPSRLAILPVCNIYTDELKDSIFCLHPRTSVVDRPACYPTIDGEEDATVVHLARFIAA